LGLRRTYTIVGWPGESGVARDVAGEAGVETGGWAAAA
jgi:hypothetical protein